MIPMQVQVVQRLGLVTKLHKELSLQHLPPSWHWSGLQDSKSSP